MHRPGLSSCLVVLAIIPLICSPLHAQYTNEVNPALKKVNIRFSAGWGRYKMGNINDHYVSGFAKPLGLLQNDVTNGINLCGEAGWFITRNISTDLAVTYLRARTGKESKDPVCDPYGNPIGHSTTKRSLTTSLIARELKVRYHLPRKKSDLFFGVGAVWCRGTAVLRSIMEERGDYDSASDESRYTAQGGGFLFSAGASHNFYRAMSFDTEIGYRHFVTGDLTDEYGEVWYARYLKSGPKMNLDFSGPFILTGLSLRL